MRRLVKDYLFRASKRIGVLKQFQKEGDFADVVLEAQEVVELLLKALIMEAGLEVPKVHDVGKYIREDLELFPEEIKRTIDEISEISRRLRKERELSFYGAADWIPSEEYGPEDAQKAISDAERIFEIVNRSLEKWK